jgi:hypothetical protein
MEPIEGENPSLAMLSRLSGDDDIAVAIFRDKNEKIRLFANFYQQHMGIQPGMGLPVYAGILTMHKNLMPGYEGAKITGYTISNLSGHYKPGPEIDINGILKEIVPADSIKRVTVKKYGKGYDESVHEFSPENQVRMHHITSPEMYVNEVNRLKTGHESAYSGVLTYLKQHELWDKIQNVYPQKNNWFTKELMRIENPSLRTPPPSRKWSTSSSGTEYSYDTKRRGESTISLHRSKGFFSTIFGSCVGKK